MDFEELKQRVNAVLDEIERNRPKQSIEDFTWSEEAVNKYRAELAAGKWDGLRRTFYIKPTGTLEQLWDSRAMITSYHRSGSTSELLAGIERYGMPLLKIEMMSEPYRREGTGEFEYRCYDLVGLILDRKDKDALRAIYEHIDFDDCSSECREKINVLMEEASGK